MPEIVEILAPSGTGKTTVYKGLQKKWTPDEPWAVYHDFRYNRKVMYSSPKDYYYVLQRKFDDLRSSFFSSEIQYQKKSVGKKPNEKTFYERHPMFCDTAMELILEHNASGFNKKDKRFLNTFFFFETIEHLQAVLNHTDDRRLCIMDEGLLSRLMHLNSPTFSNEQLNQYLENMPFPFAIIYLECDAGYILQRILSREKTATVHSSLSKDDILSSTRDTQQLMEETLQLATERGSRVIRVNAERDSDKLIKNVFEIIRKMEFNP